MNVKKGRLHWTFKEEFLAMYCSLKVVSSSEVTYAFQITLLLLQLSLIKAKVNDKIH